MSLTPQEVLDISFKSSDLRKKVTIREFLKLLLTELWVEEEGFNGKRPFGNSGWQSEVNLALVKAKAISGSVEYNDGYEEALYDDDEARKAIVKAIKAL